MSFLFIINDAPYGSEKAYNALRLATSLLVGPGAGQGPGAEEGRAGGGGVRVRVFLMGDAVTCALSGQATPKGYYNVGSMLRGLLDKGGEVKACGTCVNARGLARLPLVEGVEVSTIRQLAAWVTEADKVLTF